MEVSSQLHTPAPLISGQWAHSIHCIGNWVGPKASLDTPPKWRKVSCPCWESNPYCSAQRPSLYWLSSPSSYQNAVTMVITVAKFWSYRLFNQQYNSKFIRIMPVYKLYSRKINKTRTELKAVINIVSMFIRGTGNRYAHSERKTFRVHAAMTCILL
jgi:hypothetical protein